MRRGRWRGGVGPVVVLALALGLVALAGSESAGQPTVRQLLEPGAAAATNGDAAVPAVPPAMGGGPVDEFNRGTPRGAMEGFLAAASGGDYERAAAYLDLSHIRPEERRALGPQLARHLRVILDQMVWIDPDVLSPAADGWPDDGLPRDRDRAARVTTDDGLTVDLVLARVPTEGGPLWKVSRATVREIPELYEKLGYGALGEMLPAAFLEYEVSGVRIWQGAILLALVLVSYGIGWVASVVVGWLLGTIWRRRGRRAAGFLVGPLHLALAASVFSVVAELLPLALTTRVVLDGAETAVLIAAFTWVVLRTVDLAFRAWAERLARRGKSDALPLLPPGRRTAKILVTALAVLVIVASFGFDVTAVVAGLGVGGIALALAAQKSIENLFGGISLYADQPVKVGHFCRFGDKLGTVEEIGLRSTRIRTLDRSVLTVPNAEFAHLQIDNLSLRDRFWFNPTIGLRYETTPDQIRYVLVEIRKLLYAHPLVDPEPARIRFKTFSAYSLDLEIFAYVTVATYDEYLEVAEDLNLRIMDVVARSGSSFAFPSQTTYVEQGTALDAEASRSAEREVAAWRERGELPLPRFAPGDVDRLRGTIDYPPEGSVASKGARPRGRGESGS